MHDGAVGPLGTTDRCGSCMCVFAWWWACPASLALGGRSIPAQRQVDRQEQRREYQAAAGGHWGTGWPPSAVAAVT